MGERRKNYDEDDGVEEESVETRSERVGKGEMFM